ncbi:MAG: M24 family metallopeptidase [Limnochordia bacterium]|nr:Xaa-Pro peptidase family protein [Bacillota bacterium]NLL08050.1 aminopeptidase P family protein [Bacillota bacterium]
MAIEIPLSEFRERIAKIQKVMGRENLDALIAFSNEAEPAYVRYFSDYWPAFETAAVFIPQSGDPTLLIGPEAGTFARSRSKIEKVLSLADFRESAQPEYPGLDIATWHDVFEGLSIERLGLAGFHMFPHTIYMNMTKALGDAQVVDADNIVREIMIIKSPAEIACLRESARISELGFKAVVENIKPGMTEVQVVSLATAAILGNGAEAVGYPLWCCSGPNSTQAVSRPTHRKIQEGEIVHVQIGAKVAGYSTSVARPIVLGHCPDELRKFMQVGCDAENLAIELMVAGARAGDIAKKVHGFITDQGYGHTILYGPAHGCGQMECEWPFIESTSEVILQENMTFHICMFLGDKHQGFRFEDCIVIKDGPAEQLSNYKREVIVL